MVQEGTNIPSRQKAANGDHEQHEFYTTRYQQTGKSLPLRILAHLNHFPGHAILKAITE